jgi:hypothetical protein
VKLPGARERRFEGPTSTFGYDYFDYIDYFNHDTSSREASSKEVPEMKTCMPRRLWRQRSACREGPRGEDLYAEQSL